MRRYLRSFNFAFIVSAILILGSCKSVVIPTFSTQQQPAVPNYETVATWAILPDAYPEN